jgi:hypothetical protein
MVARWDALLVAGVLAGGWMLLEHSHRVDTGAPDEEVVGASMCTAIVSARVWKPGEENEPSDSTAAQLPPGCTSE